MKNIQKTTKPFFGAVIVFFVSLLLYIISSYYKTNSVRELFDTREGNRVFSIQLAETLRNKAGEIVKNNNFDPIVPETLLRIMLRTPEGEVISYKYDKNLMVITKGEEKIIDIRDIIDYAYVSKDSNQYTIYLD